MNPNKAISLERANMTKTYLLYDKELSEMSGKLEILGYFTLAVKNFVFRQELSWEKRKKLLGMSSASTEDIPGYLIGQIAKNSRHINPTGDRIDLHLLLEKAIERIVAAQKNVGGRFVFLDCKKDNYKVHNLYLQEGFSDYQTITGRDGVEYVQMVRFIK